MILAYTKNQEDEDFKASCSYIASLNLLFKTLSLTHSPFQVKEKKRHWEMKNSTTLFSRLKSESLQKRFLFHSNFELAGDSCTWKLCTEVHKHGWNVAGSFFGS